MSLFAMPQSLMDADRLQSQSLNLLDRYGDPYGCASVRNLRALFRRSQRGLQSGFSVSGVARKCQ